MKDLKYIMLALVCGLFTACMDGDYDESAASDDAPYGNSSIAETNLLTIAQLKKDFNKAITTDYRDGVSYQKIGKDMQIKGYVTGNDISGNIYNEVAIQDETGAILIRVQQGGLYGYLPVGAEILIDLNGLYIGNYRMQPCLGAPSQVSQGNNAGRPQLGSMIRQDWFKHVKVTGRRKIIAPEVFAEGTAATTWTVDDAGKLGIIKNVSIKNGSYYDGSATNNLQLKATSKYADPDLNNSVSWYFKEQSTSVMLYNSNYSDFAAQLLPHGKMNITGIIKRYNNNWEIIIRDLNDVEEL